MEQILAIFTNHILIAATFSWLICQISKFIITAIVEKQWRFERLVGDGGMPSGHSATVSSMATMAFLSFGAGSYQFAIALMVAIIVAHDATGVRLETGKQAVVIKELMSAIELLTNKELPEVKLKEFVGHTSVQVMAGMAIGILNGFIAYYFIY